MPTLEDLTHGQLSIDPAVLEEFCQRWKIAKLELFGSALRPDFNTESDIDLLVTYEPDASWSLLDHVGAEQEFGDLIGRKVDLITRSAIDASRNHISRKMILDSASAFMKPSEGSDAARHTGHMCRHHRSHARNQL